MSTKAHRIALKVKYDALTWKEQEILAEAFLKKSRELTRAMKRLKK